MKIELPTNYQQFIHLSRYARWNEAEGRRETWEETVQRYFDFFVVHIQKLDPETGTGVGFSVERQYVNKLPDLPEELHPTDTVIKVADSKIGWAKAYKELISLLYSGQIPQWDVSNVRPHGARLKTFGGRASGPAPLEDLFRFTINIFKDAIAIGHRKLVSIDCHDLMCKVAEVVVVGGVRRSALISLSNLSDARMRNAKSGAWWEDNQQRALSNNSVTYTDTVEMGAFMKEWLSLYES